MSISCCLSAEVVSDLLDLPPGNHLCSFSLLLICYQYVFFWLLQIFFCPQKKACHCLCFLNHKCLPSCNGCFWIWQTNRRQDTPQWHGSCSAERQRKQQSDAKVTHCTKKKNQIYKAAFPKQRWNVWGLSCFRWEILPPTAALCR